MYQTPWLVLRDSRAHVLLNLTSTSFISNEIYSRSTRKRNARRARALRFKRRAEPAGVCRVPGAHLADVWLRGRKQGVAFAFQKELRIPLKLQVNERLTHKLPQSLGTSARFHNSGDPVDVVRSSAQHWVWRTVAPPTPPQKKPNVLSNKTSSTAATGSCLFSPKSLHISAQVRLPPLRLQLGSRSPGEHLRETLPPRTARQQRRRAERGRQPETSCRSWF